MDRSTLNVSIFSISLLLGMAMPIEAQSIYWAETNSSRLRIADLDGSNPRDLIENQIPGDAIAIDAVGQHLYWFNRQSLVRSSLAGMDIEELAAIYLNSPYDYAADIAIDVPGQKIYWLTLGELVGCPGEEACFGIFSANLDGSDVEFLVPMPALNSAGGIAVDSVRGKIYWTNEAMNRIQRCNLDGSNTETYKSGLGAGVKRVAIDPMDGSVYWSEAVPGLIRRANFDGSNVTTVQSGRDWPSEVLVDSTASKLYWAENAPGSNPNDDIRRSNLDGSNVEPVRLSVPLGVRSFVVDPTAGHVYVARAIENGIGTALDRTALDGSALVTLVQSKFIAPTDIVLNQEPSRVAFFAGNPQKTFLTNLDATAQLSGTTGPGGSAAGFAISAATDTLYAVITGDCDHFEGGIKRRQSASTVWQTVVSGLECPQAVAVDDIGGKIYWAESYGRIERANMDGSNVETVISTSTSPYLIAVDSEAGKIYWAEQNTLPPVSSTIRVAKLDGSDQQVLVSGQLPIGGMSLDVANSRVYWTTGAHVRRCDTDGTNVQIVVGPLAGVPGAQGIAVSSCAPSECGGPKNRFLTYDAGRAAELAGEPIAIRLRLLDLPVFPASNGQIYWVAPHTAILDGIANETLQVARLQCTPNMQNWSSSGLIHVFGSEIVPDSTYEIRYATASCIAQGDEACLSDAKIVRTGLWGDIIMPFGSPQSTGQPDFGDISACVDKFRESPAAPSRTRAKLYGDVPDPGTQVNFSDVSALVDAFRGSSYPYAGPSACP